jgi:hypothetical protein
MVNRAAEYWPYGLIGVGIIAAILNIALYAAGVVESFLLGFLVMVVGFGSAEHNLAVGVLGVLCFWVRGDFWSATVIAFAAFGIGAAYGHIRDIRLGQNYEPGNAGPILYINDILLPLLLIILLIAYRV